MATTFYDQQEVNNIRLAQRKCAREALMFGRKKVQNKETKEIFFLTCLTNEPLNNTQKEWDVFGHIEHLYNDNAGKNEKGIDTFQLKVPISEIKKAYQLIV